MTKTNMLCTDIWTVENDFKQHKMARLGYDEEKDKVVVVWEREGEEGFAGFLFHGSFLGKKKQNVIQPKRGKNL